ncbi:aminopeptidase P N-terminal domain-containing protein [Brevibacillus migulae]|uniref:aminopeptidase P N-terminal domain-containing protein n=1 Tax=Brevibacillus migulae TaxID=1644114 RepID=UPI00106DFEAB|nr:aminopeptidase P N-terminal domain-containing protein [Brevibacillus migulae]
MNVQEIMSRRQQIMEKMPDQSILILFSGHEKTRTHDEKYPFSPNRNFYYLTGIANPNLVLMISKKADAATETLFLERPNEVAAKWTGAVITAEEAKELSGIGHYAFLDEWLDAFGASVRAADGQANVYLDLYRYAWDDETSLAEQFAERVQSKYRTATVHDAGPWLKELRMVKSPAEVEEIKKAIEITDEALRRIWEHTSPGVMEYELEAHLDFVAKSHGIRELPYIPIVAGGRNATVLHYSSNNQKIEDGQLVLIDLGMSSNYYASDITRTFPVNGKFTERQKQIYNLVLEAETKTIEAVRPGVTLQELNNITKRVLADGLKELGLIQDDTELAKYYYHGVAHHLGLDTHDIGERAAALKPGMVITVEPGLYMEEESIGIRIEDDVLVTENGFEILSSQIPKQVDDLEKIIGWKNTV